MKNWSRTVQEAQERIYDIARGYFFGGATIENEKQDLGVAEDINVSAFPEPTLQTNPTNPKRKQKVHEFSCTISIHRSFVPHRGAYIPSEILSRIIETGKQFQIEMDRTPGFAMTYIKADWKNLNIVYTISWLYPPLEQPKG